MKMSPKLHSAVQDLIDVIDKHDAELRTTTSDDGVHVGIGDEFVHLGFIDGRRDLPELIERLGLIRKRELLDIPTAEEAHAILLRLNAGTRSTEDDLKIAQVMEAYATGGIR